VHVFDTSLHFLYDFPIRNNPRDIIAMDNKLFLSISDYPAKDYAIEAYSLKGEILSQFYHHNIDDKTLVMPYFEHDKKGNIYAQRRIGYGCDIIYPDKKQTALLVVPGVAYKDYVKFEPYREKFGRSAAYLHWKKDWSEPTGIALIDDSILLLCFEEIDDDLATRNYYVDGYQVVNMKKIISWQKIPGKLLAGGKFAYISLPETNDNDDTRVGRFSIP